jgi:hypothetical protein
LKHLLFSESVSMQQPAPYTALPPDDPTGAAIVLATPLPMQAFGNGPAFKGYGLRERSLQTALDPVHVRAASACRLQCCDLPFRRFRNIVHQHRQPGPPHRDRARQPALDAGRRRRDA